MFVQNSISARIVVVVLVGLGCSILTPSGRSTVSALPTTRSVTSQELSTLANQMFQLESGVDSGDVVVSFQSSVYNKPTDQDLASNDFFSYVNENKIFTKHSYAKFIALLDNYVATTGQSENQPQQEIEEQNTFLNEILAGPVMSKAYEFLYNKGYVQSKKDLKSKMKTLWFGLYSRAKGRLDSCGFEHVFVGEKEYDSDSVTGFHNWIRFYLLESDNKLNYYGYTTHYNYLNQTPKLISTRFNWEGHIKTFGSMFYGTSPDLEMALYTTCYLVMPNQRCEFDLGQRNVRIQTYTMKQNGGEYIGTAYPA